MKVREINKYFFIELFKGKNLSEAFRTGFLGFTKDTEN
jgi:hypothetical protein